jgi:hypothetical protein
VSFFKHHRKVEHRDGPPTRELAPVKKSIYSLIDLREILLGCNRRYLAHLSALDDFSGGVRALDRLTKPHKAGERTVQGINFFAPGDSSAAACPAESKGQHRRGPPRRPSSRTGNVLAEPALAATAPVAGPRRDQTRQRDIPLLSDQGRTCPYRCGGTDFVAWTPMSIGARCS